MREVEAQVQTLKKDLQAREEEIAKIKLRAAGVAADADQTRTRIKELETKLCRIRNFEDDIADLSPL